MASAVRAAISAKRCRRACAICSRVAAAGSPLTSSKRRKLVAAATRIVTASAPRCEFDRSSRDLPPRWATCARASKLSAPAMPCAAVAPDMTSVPFASACTTAPCAACETSVGVIAPRLSAEAGRRSPGRPERQTPRAGTRLPRLETVPRNRRVEIELAAIVGMSAVTDTSIRVADGLIRHLRERPRHQPCWRVFAPLPDGRRK